MTSVTMSSTSSLALCPHENEPDCAWWTGGNFPLQVSPVERIATVRLTNTTSWFPVITGSSSGRRMRSSTSTIISAGGLSPAYLHDARSRHRGGEPLEHLPSAQGRGLLDCWKPKPSLKAPASGSRSPLTSTGTSMSPTSISPGHSSICARSSTAARAQSVHWELRDAMTEADVEIISSAAWKNIRTPNLESSPMTARSSSPAIQRVHPHLRTDPCANLALLSAEQRKDRTLAQVT